jgi:hypothetical protein
VSHSGKRSASMTRLHSATGRFATTSNTLDERIEASAAAGSFVGDSVMPSGSFYHGPSMPDRAKAQLRNFDPFTGRLSVWEDELDIDALAAELAKIGRAAGPVYGPSVDSAEG